MKKNIKKMYHLPIIVFILMVTVNKCQPQVNNKIFTDILSLHQPVTINPSAATCGEDPNNSKSVRFQTQVTCTVSCERQYPQNHFPQTFVDQPVYLERSDCSPVPDELNSITIGMDVFDTSKDCFQAQEIKFGYPIYNTLTSYTLTMRVFPTGDAGVLTFSNTLALGVRSRRIYVLVMGKATLTETIEFDIWKHVALQVNEYSVCLFLDGQLKICQEQLGVPARKKRNLDVQQDLYIAASNHTNLKQVQLFNTTLTNREIYAEVWGDLPEVHPASKCLCPPDAPQINSNNAAFCQLSTDKFNPYADLIPRLGLSDPNNVFNNPDLVNDGDLTRAWRATQGVIDVSVQIELIPGQVDSVYISLESPVYDHIIIWGRYGDTWTKWHHFGSTDDYCPSIGMVPNLYLETYDSFGCSVGYGQEFVWYVGQNRPGFGDIETQRIERFRMANAVKLQFFGVTSSTSSLAIAEVTVKGMNMSSAGGQCQCDVHGSTPGGQQCDDEGQCTCKDPKPQHIELAGKTCAPYIADVLPNYGPISGGTTVLLYGGYLGDGNNTILNINIGPTTCPIIASNGSHVLCRTFNMTGSGLEGKPQMISVILNSGYKVGVDEAFIFGKDPSINNVFPRQSILRGGINLTVTGQNLDSVFLPIMTVTMNTRNHHQPQENSTCHVVNSTVMLCPTPPIELPADFPRDRQKRSIDISDSYTIHKRATTFKNYINQDNIIDFYLGFILDGILDYQNLSSTHPEISQLLMYYDPYIEIFEETYGNEVHTFNTYETDFISMKGRNLLGGVNEEHYEIWIGKEQCILIQLYDNALFCQPPKQQPEPRPNDYMRGGGMQVKVEIAKGALRYSPGYLKWQHYNPWWIYGPVIAVVVLLVLIVLVVLYRKRRALCPSDKHLRRHDRHQINGVQNDSRYSTFVGVDFMTRINPDLTASIEGLLIEDTTRMDLGNKIGQGQFGMVYSGRLLDKSGQTWEKVAIKTVKAESWQIEELEEFLREALVMKDLHHPHILEVLGVVIKDNKPHVILPFMANKDLRSYVSNPANHFVIIDLVRFAHQVACGMSYLERERFIHRDLAARNCMVSEEQTVKIADFGLARDIYMKDYYRPEAGKRRYLPYKWMAIECLEGHEYTTKSDVWSFGILLWELLTRGKKPYPDVENFDLLKFLKQGRRLRQPSAAPDEMYHIMVRCWQTDPTMRPSFYELEQILKNWISGPGARSRGDYIDTGGSNTGQYLHMKELRYSEIPVEEQLSAGVVHRPSNQQNNAVTNKHSDDGYLNIPDAGQAAEGLEKPTTQQDHPVTNGQTPDGYLPMH